MRKHNSDFKTSFISEAGSLIQNKDYFAFVELDDMACWVAADGLDADIEIESAKEAVQSILHRFTQKPTMSKRKLKKYMIDAHQILQEQSIRVRLKVSLTLVVTDYVKTRYATVGNTRFYLFRKGNITLKSKDQSVYQQMIDIQEVPDDGTRGFEERNNLREYLGNKEGVHPFVSKKVKLEDEDIILLCTHGFWEKINDIEILDGIEEAKDPEELNDTLQELLLSKQTERLGNYTLVSVFVNKIFKQVNNKKKYIKMMTIILIPVIMMLAVGLIYRYIDNQKRMQTISVISQYEKQANDLIEEQNFDRALKQYEGAIKETQKLKKKKDQHIKDRIIDKQRISQLIVDADDFFDEKKYEKSQKNYEKAHKQICRYDGDDIEVDINDIQSKIEKNKKYKDVLDETKLGDLQVELGEWDVALQTYQEAKMMATKVNFKESEKELKLKIEELRLNKKQKEKEQNETEKENKQEETHELEQQLKNRAAQLEKEADGLVLTFYYDEAIDQYTKAQETYEEANDSSKAESIYKKIDKVELKQKELELKKKQLDAEAIETKADESLADLDYVKALEYYAVAQSQYQTINQLDKVFEIERIMRGIEDLQKSINENSYNNLQ